MGIALVADTAAPLELEYDTAQRALEIAAEHGDERLRAMCLALSAVGRFYADPDGGWELAERRSAPRARGARRSCSRRRPGCRRSSSTSATATRRPRSCSTHRSPHCSRAATAAWPRRCSASRRSARWRRGRGERPALAIRGVEVAEPLPDYHRVGMARSVLALMLGSGGTSTRARRRADRALVEGAATSCSSLGWRGRCGCSRCGAARPRRLAGGWCATRMTGGAAGTYLEPQALPAHAGALRRLGRTDGRGGHGGPGSGARRGDRHPAGHRRGVRAAGRLGDPDDGLDLHHQALATAPNTACAASTRRASRRSRRGGRGPPGGAVLRAAAGGGTRAGWSAARARRSIPGRTRSEAARDRRPRRGGARPRRRARLRAPQPGTRDRPLSRVGQPHSGRARGRPPRGRGAQQPGDRAQLSI